MGDSIHFGYLRDYRLKARPIKRLAVTGQMGLGAELEPGEYILQMVVRDKLARGKHSMATQWIDFEVLK